MLRSLLLLLLAVAACASTAGTTRIVVLRHAEKQQGAGNDPSLTDAGRARALALVKALQPYEVTALYATHFKRTQETLAPLAQATGRAIVVLNADDVDGLIERLRALEPGSTAVVAGHSDTVPQIVKGLGVAEPIELSADGYGDLFIIERGRDGQVRMTRGRF